MLKVNNVSVFLTSKYVIYTCFGRGEGVSDLQPFTIKGNEQPKQWLKINIQKFSYIETGVQVY